MYVSGYNGKYRVYDKKNKIFEEISSESFKNIKVIYRERIVCKDGSLNMVNKENRQEFLEYGCNLNGTPDLRLRKNKIN